MDCVTCHQPITNPVCPACLAEGMQQWLAETAPSKVDDLQAIVPPVHMSATVACVRCNTKMCECAYCFTKDVFNWLRDGTLQINYLQYFNLLT